MPKSIKIIYEDFIHKRGFRWIILYIIYKVTRGKIMVLERALRKIEYEKHILGNWTIISHTHTRTWNKQNWDSYDWKGNGEEWTRDAARYKNINPARWKRTLLKTYLVPYIHSRQQALEIGCGAGRWTAEIAPRVLRLYACDISPVAISVCRKRLSRLHNIQYKIVSDNLLSFLDNGSVDFAWSYDVFVHINANDMAIYIRSLKRVLKPGAYCVIHHAGEYKDDIIREQGLRSWMSSEFFADIAHAEGLRVIKQDFGICHYPGDVLTVLQNTM